MIEVDLGSGRVAGLDRGTHVEFWGIPYAAAPLGPARFQAPGPEPAWSGVRECFKPGPMAPQPPGLLEGLMGVTFRQSEDCLTVNVAAPPLDGVRRPVLVWLHGGGFVTGTGALPWFDARAFVAQGIVVVTVNYRLGVLGWADLSGLGAEAPVNRGLLDQVAALRWIREHIHAFGGDSDEVTLAGESAGAMSIAALLAVPAAARLFARAILWSGSAHDVLDRAQAADNAGVVLDELGPGGRDLRRLAELPVEDLLSAQGALLGQVDRSISLLPVVDGDVLPCHPLRAVRAGAARGVGLLVGTNLDEIGIVRLLGKQIADAFLAEYRARFERLLGKRAVAAANVYPPGANGGRDIAIASDQLHRIPSTRLAEAQRAAGGQVHLALFSWPSPVDGGHLGACHTLDLPFVFDCLDAPGAECLVGQAPPRGLASALNSSWASFVQTGSPETVATGSWPVFDPGTRPTMIFGTSIGLASDPYAARRRVWDGVL
jgi:para-nitrobenzyl esterase